MPRVFATPRRFHPGYSLLGRWLRRRTGDRRYAEALHVLLLTGLVLALLFLHYLRETLLYDQLVAYSSAGLIYGLILIGLVGLVLVTCVVGIRPALTVTCDADAVHLEQGERALTVPYATLSSVHRITARRFHRHECRYAATRPFIGVLQDEVLLLRPARGGPVAIGLPSADLDALHDHLETARMAARTEGDFAKGREGELESG